MTTDTSSASRSGPVSDICSRVLTVDMVLSTPAAPRCSGDVARASVNDVWDAVRPVRVCLIYDCLFPCTVGGAERWYRSLAERLAGAFAAKEATRKAFGFAIPWRLVGVSHEPSGRPFLQFFGRAAELPRRFALTRTLLTITHTKSMASAVVILERD